MGTLYPLWITHCKQRWPSGDKPGRRRRYISLGGWHLRRVSCEILCTASQARCEDLAAELASKEREEEREEEEEEHSREVEELRGEVFALNAKVRV